MVYVPFDFNLLQIFYEFVFEEDEKNGKKREERREKIYIKICINGNNNMIMVKEIQEIGNNE